MQTVQHEELATELRRRFGLWAPDSYVDSFPALYFFCMIEQRKASKCRDALGWLRIVQKSMCVQSRFGTYVRCLICGEASDSLPHVLVRQEA